SLLAVSRACVLSLFLLSFSSLMTRRPPRSTLFPSRRSSDLDKHRSAPEPRHGAAGPGHPHGRRRLAQGRQRPLYRPQPPCARIRSEEHTSELQSRFDLVCRLLLEKKKKNTPITVRRHAVKPH